MKIVDMTPFLNEKGEISLVDRVKTMLKYGKPWMDEVDAQKAVIPVLEKALDKNYTLLRNITLPDAATSIPLILVGPPGIFVIYVTHLVGMFRAKGDQWGTVDDNAFKLLKPNLLTRTESMARAVQVYLERHGYNDMTLVEPILLCADSRVHVDSIRPIVRVVMRDALERLALSISQARPVYSPEAVYKLANLIVSPPQSKLESSPEEAPEDVLAVKPTESVGQAQPPVAILLPGDELFPRAGLTPKIEQPAQDEQPLREEKTLSSEKLPTVEQPVKEGSLPSTEQLPKVEKPARETLYPWNEQSPLNEQTPTQEKALQTGQPAKEILFPWNEPAPQMQQSTQEERFPSVKPLPPDEQPPVDEPLLQGEQSFESVQQPAEIQGPASKPATPKRKVFSRKQWFFLAAMLVIWFLLVAIFIIKVVSDLVL